MTIEMAMPWDSIITIFENLTNILQVASNKLLLYEFW